MRKILGMLNYRLNILILIVNGDSQAFWGAKQKISFEKHYFRKHLSWLHKQQLRECSPLPMTLMCIPQHQPHLKNMTKLKYQHNRKEKFNLGWKLSYLNKSILKQEHNPCIDYKGFSLQLKIYEQMYSIDKIYDQN